MARKLSEIQKEEIVKFFISGKTIDELSKEFNFTKLTIVRNLKKILGEKKYEEFIIKSKSLNNDVKNNEKKIASVHKDDLKSKSKNAKYIGENSFNKNIEEELVPLTSFAEIAPLDFEIQNETQKDLSSTPISEIKFPNIVYMIVNKKIELEIKFLKEYSEWQFLSEEELNRKTIQIYNDLKIAKKFCNKEQKVIKIPNTDVFKIVSSQLIAKGITRIVSSDKLIAL